MGDISIRHGQIDEEAQASMMQEFYKDCDPASYLLRKKYPERWFRIHSLPESNRYAEDEREWSILLERHREVSGYVLGTCDVVTVWWRYQEHLGSLHAAYSREYIDDVQDPYRIRGCDATWPIPDFDDIIRLVAVDQVRNLTFMSPANGDIYAPYDGGADIFMVDAQRLEQFKVEFRKYKSIHITGL